MRLCHGERPGRQVPGRFIIREESRFMSVIRFSPPVGGFARFLFLGLAVSATSLLATFAFVVFILVPEEVRSATLRGPLFPWGAVVGAARPDHSAGMPLPEPSERNL